jgi:hypothetical protein
MAKENIGIRLISAESGLSTGRCFDFANSFICLVNTGICLKNHAISLFSKGPIFPQELGKILRKIGAYPIIVVMPEL